MYANFAEMLQAAKRGKTRVISVAAAADRDVLAAAKLAEDSGIARFLLVGDEAALEPLHREIGLSPHSKIVHASTEQEALTAATALVRDGQANLLMKGMVNTSNFLKAVLHADSGLRTERLLSHLAAYELPRSGKLVFHTDTGMNVAPDEAGKAQILTNAALALHALGVRCPKVAVLTANEQVNPKIQSTVDAARLVERARAGELPPMLIEGPIAMDVALDPAAAAHKGIDSKISGDVDLFLVPSIEAGNIMGKALLYYTDAKMAGVVLGAGCPIVLTSRAESPQGKLHSIAMACLLA